MSHTAFLAVAGFLVVGMVAWQYFDQRAGLLWLAGLCCLVFVAFSAFKAYLLVADHASSYSSDCYVSCVFAVICVYSLCVCVAAFVLM